MEPGGPTPKSKTVLIVEDHADTAEMLVLILQSEGYDIRTARTAREAIKALSSAGNSQIDLVLLDLTLPDMSGDELIEQVKQSCVSVPPVFIMSAKTVASLNDAARSIGAAGVIRKPFDIQALLENIEAELGKHPRNKSK